MTEKTDDQRAQTVEGDAHAESHTAADFFGEMEAANLAPLWDRYAKLNIAEPVPRDPGLHYKWETLLPLIDRASSEVSVEEAERRVLMLLNPAFKGPPATTTGLFGAIQILLPGEAARSHRHTAAAFRFVMEGNGATTFVNAGAHPMQEHDLILTPNWTWHEHENHGDQRIIWFDGLDLPFMLFCNVGFTEQGDGGTSGENREPDRSSLPDESFAASGVMPETDLAPTPYSPKMRYPWDDVLTALAGTPTRDDGAKVVHYTNPDNGGPIMPTMDAYVLELPVGTETRPLRTTANTIAIVAEGEGTTHVGEITYEWKKNDIFTLPQWSWTTHTSSRGPARLFLSSDRNLQRTMNYLREEWG